MKIFDIFDKRKVVREIIILLFGLLAYNVISQYVFSKETANFIVHVIFAYYVMKQLRSSLIEASKQDDKK